MPDPNCGNCDAFITEQRFMDRAEERRTYDGKQGECHAGLPVGGSVEHRWPPAFADEWCRLHQPVGGG